MRTEFLVYRPNAELSRPDEYYGIVNTGLLRVGARLISVIRRGTSTRERLLDEDLPTISQLLAYGHYFDEISRGMSCRLVLTVQPRISVNDGDILDFETV
jgi:hypothetical protein